MKKKILIPIFLILILLTNMSFAATSSSVTMEVVEEPICTIDITENSKFEKKLIEKDLNNKEVTIQLQVTNNETARPLTGELMLVVDISNSLSNQTDNGQVRKQTIYNSAKTLISKLLQDNDKLKVGITAFSSNTDVSKEGTIEDAKLISSLNNSSEELSNALTLMTNEGPRTNLQSGLRLATEQFSDEENNKYIIVLTDGVPNIALDYNRSYYSDDVIAKTKQELLDIEDDDINIITMLTGIDDEEYVPGNATKSFGQIIEEIFGTTTNPTAGKFYYISQNEIEETITNDIYSTLVPEPTIIKNLNIVDYFPEEIVKNFDFAYVTDTNIGTISPKIDTTTNSITWTIPELKQGETATVQYKLKLKDTFDSNIIDKVLNTNEKVDITYEDENGNEQKKTSTVTPKLKLTNKETQKNNTPSTNTNTTTPRKNTTTNSAITQKTTTPTTTTTATTILPKAGKTTLLSVGILLIAFAGYSVFKYINISKDLK